MAYSYEIYTASGSNQFVVPFGYIRREHVLATVNGTAATFAWINSGLIQLDTTPSVGASVRVYRLTPLTAPLVDFTDGATLVAADLDTNANQSIYTQQELSDSQAEGLANVIPNGDKGDITTSVGGTVWTIDNSAVTNAKIGAGAVTETKIGTGAVTEAKIGTGAVTEVKIATDAVTETKIGTGAVTSTKIADGTILNADINASAAIVGTKISPNFGSQNVATTGTSTAASFSPSSSTAPTTGMYLPGTDTFGISTNGIERTRITTDGARCYNQPTFSTYTTAATLSAADLKAGLILGTTFATGQTFTLPTGTDIDSAFSNPFNNMTFEWSFVNNATAQITLAVNTGHTILNSMSLNINSDNCRRFATRRTGSGTYVSYRIG